MVLGKTLRRCGLWRYAVSRTGDRRRRPRDGPARSCNVRALGRVLSEDMIVTEEDWSALLRAANAGDGRAYARFLSAVTPVLRHVVRARGPGLSDSHEDIVQEVLLAIHLKRHTWAEDRPLRPWLYAIARHKTVDAFRRRGVAVHLPIEDWADRLEDEAVGDPTATRDTDRLLSSLEPRMAEIVRAARLEGEEAAAIGARLAMTEGAVRVTLYRAMKRLVALGRGGGS